MRKKFLIICGLIGLGLVGRLVPHLPNATPITAITIAGSKYVGRVSTILIPITTMMISDMVIGFYDWKILFSVYGSFILIGLLSLSTKKYPGIFPVGLLILIAPLLFFLVTNFTVWLFSPWYEKSIWGLLYCYQLGIPFLRNMFIGDLVYTSLLLGIFAMGHAKIAEIRFVRWNRLHHGGIALGTHQ